MKNKVQSHFTRMYFLVAACFFTASLPLHAESKTETTDAYQIFQQKIDHFKESDTRTFAQRYYVNSKYVENSETAPVMYYVCPESECDIPDILGTVERYAKDHKAHIVALEHRYYGTSQPFEALSTKNLKYLRINQVLADYAHFAEFAKSQFKMRGPWIALGKSYSGIITAYFRAAYPKVTLGGIASGAPIKPARTQSGYDRYSAEQVGPHCALEVRRIIKQIEEILKKNDRAEINKLKISFQSAKLDDADFLNFVSDMFGISVQYGFKEMLCEAIDKPNPIEAVAETFSTIQNKKNLDSKEWSKEFLAIEDPKVQNRNMGYRQFTYQLCADLGLWPVPDADPNMTLRSPATGVKYGNHLCHALFGLKLPKVKSTVGRYYKGLKSPRLNNLLFVLGETDPWNSLSVTEENREHLNKNLQTLMMKGAPHCADMRIPKETDLESVKNARTEISKIIGQWLEQPLKQK